MIYAKKTFGQNFLKDRVALEKIILAGEIKPREAIVEIGPGRGALTKFLLGAGAIVHAVEIDPDMIEVLRDTFPDEIKNGMLVIHQADILETDITTLGLTAGEYKVIANIPYYITGLILRKFLQSDTQPRRMVLLVQKEVAERIVDGQPGGKKKKDTRKQTKENILSLSVKVYADARYVTTVGAKSFSPAPKVDSAVIELSHISKEKLIQAGITDDQFFTLIKQAFAQKRKTLVNNLKQHGHETKIIEHALDTIDVDHRVRAEVLSLEQWLVFIKNVG